VKQEPPEIVPQHSSTTPSDKSQLWQEDASVSPPTHSYSNLLRQPPCEDSDNRKRKLSHLVEAAGSSTPKRRREDAVENPVNISAAAALYSVPPAAALPGVAGSSSVYSPPTGISAQEVQQGNRFVKKCLEIL
jgi:hypothetical protein